MQNDLVEQGAIPQLIEMLRRFCFDGGLEAKEEAKVEAKVEAKGEAKVAEGMGSLNRNINDEVDVNIQSDALHILSSLCKNSILRYVN